MSVSKVAVIGAGASGLPAIKACLEEGIEPRCFERNNKVGGLWNFSETTKPDQAYVARSTAINVPKEQSCYTDFLLPKEFSNFPSHSKFVEYFDLYAKQFGLYKYIRFNTNVIEVTPTDDHTKTGRWVVKYQKDGEESSSETFDGVLLCTGHHRKPFIPSIQGLEDFKGSYIHTREYKDARPYVDKNVLVIGAGNSGCDAAVDLSYMSKQVFLSRRRGIWFFQRFYQDGLPSMLKLFRRVTLSCPQYFMYYFKKIILSGLNHETYNIKMEHNLFDNELVLNDEIPICLNKGTIILKSEVKKFTSHGVIFTDGSSLEDIDHVIFATGYLTKQNCLPDGIVKIIDDRVPMLYKAMIPPDLKHPTFALIGTLKPVNAINPILDMQCRWVIQVFKRNILLPSKDEMWRIAKTGQPYEIRRKGQSRSSQFTVGWVAYMDFLAKDLGCMPKFWPLFVKDPHLALRYYFGPIIPSHYRLTGPKKWSGARDAIMTTWDRVYFPLNKNMVGKKDNTLWILLGIFFAVMSVIIFYFTGGF